MGGTMQDKFVSYLRVSTDRQGRSGLGLEAQRAAVAVLLSGGAWEQIGEHVEIESGRVNTRPKLAEALAFCRLTGATLLVAKLDRLSRDAHFLLGLERADVPLKFADMPHANRLTIGIMAMFAEEERELISQRTKAALAAAKARGTKLGGYKGGPVPDAGNASAARVAKADAFAARVGPLAQELQASGMALEAIARELTVRGVKTARGGAWTGTAVKNLLAREVRA